LHFQQHSSLSYQHIFFAHQATFEENFSLGKINTVGDAFDKDSLDPGKKFVQVQCMPLTTLLLALNRTTVDYLSLDVEGNELDVLKTINYDLIDIKVCVRENCYYYNLF
jgi:FkbM family methyltransferase